MKSKNKSRLYFTARKQQKTAYRKTYNYDFGRGWDTLTQEQWVNFKLHPERLTEDEFVTASWDSVKGCLQGWRGLSLSRGVMV